MNRTLAAGVAIGVLVVLALVVVWVSNDGQPAESPSPAVSPTTPESSVGATPSSASSSSTAVASPPVSTSPTGVPSSTGVPSPTTVPSSTPGSQFSPIPDLTPPPGIVAGGAVATDLESLGFCDPAAPSIAAVSLTWRPAATGGQLVAVATRPDGFETGRFTVSAELPAGQDQFTFAPVEPGGVYYWRVLTRSGPGWAASEIATFTGPTCIIDNP